MCISKAIDPARSLCFCTFIFLSACGGSNDETESVVSVQTPSCPVANIISAAECTTDTDTDNNPQNNPPTELTVDTLLAGSVAHDGVKVYKAPSDAEIILTTTSGNANLYLYNSEELEDENLVCHANFPFREDNCTASVSDGELYAVVHGKVASSFNLSATTDCSVESVNRWVYRNMQDYYLYADQLPNVNPADYSNTSDLIRDLRAEPYSGITNAEQQQLRLEQGKSFGFGFDWDNDTHGNPRILYTFDNSPMGRGGVNRGDIIHSVNNVLWSDLNSESYFNMVGDRDNPLSSNWQFIDAITGNTKSVTLKQTQYTTNTVLYVNAFTNSDFSAKIGYIVFDQFLRISESELDNAINRLRGEEITELVLDLRYNSGGFTSIARKLASQIAGASVDGKTLVRYQHNTKYADENFERTFESATITLDLNRLVVLTTRQTASSSELLINALRPYIEVITIGEQTRGKAFSSSSRKFCGKSLNAMEAISVNSSGVSVEGGIAADCFAADDNTRDFGKRSGTIEGMLLSSLDYLVLGTCKTPAITKRNNFANALEIAENPSIRAIAVQNNPNE